MQAFNTLHKYYFICLSETYVDFSISIEEKSLIIGDYKLLRADHPSDTKRGGVCIYHKEVISVQVLKVCQLPEFLICEVSIQNKRGLFVTLYRSPSQSHDCFQIFLREFEKLLFSITKKRTDFTTIVADFNARSTTWWSGDITTTEGTNIEALTSCHGFEQVINEPLCILPSSASCTDLIFAEKPNLIVESGVFPSPHEKCHPQILYSKLNLNVVYSPPYQRLIWGYKKANVDGTRKSLDSVTWGFVLSDKNVHEQVQYLNEILMNVFYNYIPNKWITIDDKDPPWMNDEIKNKINYRNTFYQQLKKHKINLTDLDVVNKLTLELSSIISQRKDEYYCYLAKKLNDLQTNSKTYSSILKTFLVVEKYQLYHLFSLMANLYQILKKKLTDLMNFLVVSVHLLTMRVNVQVSLFLFLMRDFTQLFLMIRISTKLLEL